MTAFTRPPFDAEVAAALAAAPFGPSLTAEMIRQRRGDTPPPVVPALPQGVTHSEFEIAGYEGDPIVVSVFARADHVAPGPGILHTHGGGMVSGDRYSATEQILEWVARFGAVCVSVEYRLAPEHPDPIPVEDCFAALLWTAENAESLGIDPARLLIAGTSAGGGLAAGTALLARDRQGPPLIGQVLICPMLDDRNDTISAYQFDGHGGWDRTSNIAGWTALLGRRRGTDAVSIYAAPARATDLSGLPPTFIDVGSAEVFRDEDVQYATRIWECGGVAELHVWPGGFHGFDRHAPHAGVSRSAYEARDRWMARLLADGPDTPAGAGARE